MSEIKLNFLQNELVRVSEWIKLSDSKSAFLTIYYSVLFGFFLPKKDGVITKVFTESNRFPSLYLILLIIFLFFLLLGVYFLILSIFPKLKMIKKKSLLYFGSISKLDFEDYLKQIEALKEDEIKEQVLNQIYVNSLIANQKMRDVSKSIISLFISTLGLTLLLVL